MIGLEINNLGRNWHVLHAGTAIFIIHEKLIYVGNPPFEFSETVTREEQDDLPEREDQTVISSMDEPGHRDQVLPG